MAPNIIERGADSVKSLPKGVILTAAGLGIAIGVLILIRNRNKPKPTTADTTNTDAGMGNTGQMTDAGSPVAYGSWGGGVDAGSLGGGNTLDGTTDPFADATNNVGGLLALIQGIQDIFGGSQPATNSATGGVPETPVASTGGGSGSTSPTNPGTGQTAPIYTPGTPPPSPAPVPQGSSSTTLFQCPSGFPHYNPTRKKCYKVVCRSHVKWHIYSDGTEIKVAGSKC